MEKNNTVREYNSKIIKELIHETKPEEMERINNEMERISKLTVVEWLQEALEHTILTHEQIMQTIGLFEQAKEMEKEQIVHAHLLGLIHPLETEATKQAEQYYNETYEKE